MRALPSAQPELTEKVEEILTYLDTELHPLVSPDHWNVYSDLYDMISTLPTAQSERKKGKWILKPNIYGVVYCSECDYELHTNNTNFCPNCGADMRDENNNIPIEYYENGGI